MRVEEKLVEEYVRYVKGWFTMSNIKCKNNKEIDLLAIAPNGDKYHIETTIYLDGWPLEIEERGRKNVVTVRWYSEYKFLDKNVREKIKEIFGADDLNSYKRVMVYWKIKEGITMEEIKKEAEKNHIDDIWLLPDIIRELSTLLENGELKDNVDVFRMIRLVSEAKNIYYMIDML